MLLFVIVLPSKTKAVSEISVVTTTLSRVMKMKGEGLPYVPHPGYVVRD